MLALEINLGLEKLLIFDTCKPPNINNGSFLNELYNAITFYSTSYKNCVLPSDLNIARNNTQLQYLCESFLFEHFIKKQSFCKGDTPTGIGHIITNISKRFIVSIAFETAISDHQKMIMTIFCSTFGKGKLKTAAIKSFIWNCFKWNLKKN